MTTHHQYTRFRHRLSRQVLDFQLKFCRTKLRHGGQRRASPDWPKLVLWVCVYSGLRLTVELVLSYLHDYYRIRSEAARARQPVGRDANSTSLSEGDQVESGRLLKAWGAPFVQAPAFMVEGALVLVLFLTLVAYGHTQIYYSHSSPLDLSFVNVLLYPEEEIDATQKMIDSEIQRIKNSSCNHLGAHAELRNQLQLATSHDNPVPPGERELGHVQSFKQLLKDHLELVAILDHLRNSGKLQPSNREPQQIDGMALKFNLITTGNFIYSSLFNWAIFVWLPLRYLEFQHETGPLDLLLGLDLAIQLVMSVVAISFYWTLTTLEGEQQIRLVAETSARLINCIGANVQLIELSKRRPGLFVMSDFRRQINANLLLGLLSYRIFRADYERLRNTFTFSSHISIGIFMIMPLLIRLHTSYVPGKAHALVFYFCLINLAFFNGSQLPMARLDQGAVRLAGAFWSLAAHLAEYQSSCCYFLHTRQLLLKELSHPELMASQFAIRAFHLDMTYANLVQLHCWYSIIVISVQLEVPSLRERFGWRLDDPLGMVQGI